MSANPIMIDDRAGSQALARLLPGSELCRLDAGDVMIIGNGAAGTALIGVEVKSIWDLISSMETGRLQATQLPALLSTYDQSWLLYYGSYRSGPKGELQLRRGQLWKGMTLGKRQVPYLYLESFLMTLATLGVNVKHTYDFGEAAGWLSVLHRWWSKRWEDHKSLRALDKSRDVSLMPGMAPDVHLRTKVAAQLPGVGFERAIAAARHFGSVSAMINADAGEWMKVNGIGKVIARAVVEAVR